VSDWVVLSRNVIDVLDAVDVTLAEAPGLLKSAPDGFIEALRRRLVMVFAAIDDEYVRRDGDDRDSDDPDKVGERLETRSEGIRSIVRERIKRQMAGEDPDEHETPDDAGTGCYL
jgi:hypothetical protein